MALISAITTCKGRLAHLKQSLPALMATGMEVIVVDYDCPDHAGAWVSATWPDARVVAVSDRPRFNLSAARNLGAAVASHEWLVFLDADVIVAPSFMTVVEPLLRGGVFLLPDPRPPDLWGAIAVARRHFDAIGGYDEVFEGWGVEDVDFIERLLIGGLQQAPFPGELLRAIEHGETERTRFHEMIDRELNASINGFYRIAKNDLARHGELLPLEARQRLYASIRAAMLAPEPVRTIQVPVRTTLVHKYNIDVFLRYDFRPRSHT